MALVGDTAREAARRARRAARILELEMAWALTKMAAGLNDYLGDRDAALKVLDEAAERIDWSAAPMLRAEVDRYRAARRAARASGDANG